MPPPPPRRVAFLLFPGFQLLDVAGPLQTMATAAQIAGRPAYDIRTVSMAGGPVRSSSGAAMTTEPVAALSRLALDTLVVPGGPGVLAAADDRDLVRWVGRRARTARRAGSVCSGAFVMAATGLLDGLRVATHWWRCDALAARFPRIVVERDAIHVREGKFFTSAGVTAGIDLALALVEEDLGRRVAMATARHLVVFLRRPGGQSQFSAELDAQCVDDGRFDELHRWISENLRRRLDVDTLAARAGMSARHFARVYRARTGATPARAVERFRLEAARRALEAGDERLDVVARGAGLGSADRLRAMFRRHLGVAPRAYRERFAAAR